MSFTGKQKKKRKKRKANIAIASIENAEYEDYPNSEEAKSVNDEEKSGEKFTNNFISCNNSKSTEKTSSISTPTSYTSAGNSAVALEVKPGVEANLNTNDEGEGDGISQNGANFYSSKLVDVTNQNRKDHGISRTPPRCETVATQAPADEILKTVDNVQEQKSDQTEQLKLRSEDNKKGLTFQEHRSVNDTDQIIGEEPLVELSSGVVLTPVPCSDEARIWALQESNDSEGSGNEGIVDVSNSVTLRLLGRFTRDSPVSRLVKWFVQDDHGGIYFRDTDVSSTADWSTVNYRW